MYDVIVIGMGSAGISAAIYATRSGLKTLILEKEVPGGLINYTGLINNYPGLPNISGADLAYKFFEHVNELKIEYKIEEVVDISLSKEIKKIKTNKKEYLTKTVIIATGRSHRKLEIDNASKYEGTGISYCAICDGPLYKDKEIAVIGGGNSSLSQTIYLANLCKKVTLLNRGNKMRATDTLQNKVKKLDNVEIMMETQVVEIIGNKNKLQSLILSTGEEIKIDALFVYIGFDPATKFVKDLNITNEYGYIIVNNRCETKIPGIFACGDIIVKDLYQIITATSEGAIAATSAFEYLKEK